MGICHCHTCFLNFFLLWGFKWLFQGETVLTEHGESPMFV